MDQVVERRDLGPFSVALIGFGAMRLTGPNVFGPPRDRREAIRVLREAVERGVDHIDTAQFYGPNTSMSSYAKRCIRTRASWSS
jgi:pyridoxine 4-dehydrogenase